MAGLERIKNAKNNHASLLAGVRVLEARAQLGIAVGKLYPQTQQASGSLQYYRTSERSPQAALAQSTSSKSGPQSSGSNLFEFWQD